jgi:hypothetical protein
MLEANAAEVEQWTRSVLYALIALGTIGWVIWRAIRRE